MYSLESDLQESVKHSLEKSLNTALELLDFKSIAGGCINNGGKLLTDQGTYFLKWNDAHRYPDMFKKESLGLGLLIKSETVKIPSVIVVGETSRHQYIILEFIEPGRPGVSYENDLGYGLAAMHKHTAEQFGLDHDNYIGSLPQYNTEHDHWIDFLIEERLTPQLKLAVDTNKFHDTGKFEKLFAKLPALIPEERPALLHGDLWGGNVITDQDGNAVLIDPAVYYGHREMEVAYTQLFGGFSPDFYNVYSEAFPLAPDFQNRVDLYNLYPLLVHVNLFGGSYASQVLSILNRFV